MIYQEQEALFLQKRRPAAAKFATVVAVSGGKATLKFDGETAATQKGYNTTLHSR